MTGFRENDRRVDVLGVGISITNLQHAVAQIESWLDEGTRSYVCVTGVHGVMTSQGDAKLKAIHNSSGMTVPDGMPMTWSGKIYGFKQMGRVFGPDLMRRVCQRSVRKPYKHFLYGGNDGVAEKVKANLEAEYPGIAIVGTYTPPFRPLNPKERETLAKQVAICRPDLFWVGLSTPKQETFMYDYLPQLETKVMLGVGAAFDILAGLVREPPDWIKTSGMQWCYRLFQDPLRLGRRYLTHNPVFVYKFIHQLLKDKRHGVI